MKLGRREFLGLAAAGGAFHAAAGAVRESEQETRRNEKAEMVAAERGEPWLELSESNLAWNLRQIESRAGKPVMAVVKANGYGHGLEYVARALERAGVRHFLTGNLVEAYRLRIAGIRGRILNFGPFAESDAPQLAEQNITQNVFSDQVAQLNRAAAKLNRGINVQIKVDTGLGRFGVHHERCAEYLERVAQLRGMRVEGVFTTLTEDHDFDRVQLARLQTIRERVEASGRKFGVWHAASSDAVCDLLEACRDWDLVRPGIALYGLYPSERAEKEKKIELRPVLTLKARVTQVKTLEAGESASYHRAFTATQAERMAAIPAGYSDGVPRGLAGKGFVLIGGRRCPIVAISANATIARLGDVAANSGDEAVFIGTQGNETILLSEIASLIGSSVYAVAMGMNPQLPRRMILI
jgi:alanine racemase